MYTHVIYIYIYNSICNTLYIYIYIYVMFGIRVKMDKRHNSRSVST